MQAHRDFWTQWASQMDGSVPERGGAAAAYGDAAHAHLAEDVELLHTLLAVSDDGDEDGEEGGLFEMDRND